ncbi:MAG: hypothetical protein BLM47_09700 [Candidatus Reconcilbacillus cellulovorans]|uniref:FAD/NAD(P)-binding domain-containing protein n=1 Tax=Candidatus Reconcilbacillus cellulovorans TaxID=1906605 RepID=A0A2A6DYX4_9BACL|nr:MAG: hypothetical protein BLM47_09700 [Candidatus Reconcilbacillus cellulovorans]
MNPNVGVLIAGAGPAGVSAAVWCARLGLAHLLVERGSEIGGQLESIHNPVVDYPGVWASDGRELKRRFLEHLQRSNCTVWLESEVVAVDPAARAATVAVRRNGQIERKTVTYEAFILATGARPRKLGVPGEEQMYARGETFSTVRDREQFSGKRVAVVGGGDRAFEGALLLAESGAEVFLIHRSDRFRARRELLEPAVRHPSVRLMTCCRVVSVLGSDRTEAVEICDASGTTRRLDVDAVLVRIGTEAESSLFKPFISVLPDGRIPVGEAGCTELPDHYAVGDVAVAPVYSSIAAAVAQGMMAVKHFATRRGHPV